MATLLGINFGGQRHSYFQVRITIHELTNVPMVAGHFKAKWRVDHSHNLASAIAAATAASAGGDGDEGAKSSDVKSSERLLHHKKSTSTLNSVGPNAAQGDRDETGSVDSGSVRVQSGKGDDASSTYSGHKRNRKSGHRFLSGLREAFQHSSNNGNGGSNNGSNHNGDINPPTAAEGSGTPQNTTKAHISTSVDTVTQRTSTSLRRNRPTSSHNEDESPKEEKRRGDTTATTKNKRDSQLSTAASHDHGNATPSLLTFEPRGETSSATVKDNRVVWDRRIDVGVRVGVEKQRVTSGGSGALHHQHSLQDLHHQAKEHGSTGAANSGTATPHNGSRSHDVGMRRSTSTREVPGHTTLDGDRKESAVSGTNTPRDREAAENVRFGALGQSELRISVKADVPTGTGQSHNVDSHHTSMRLGYLAVNLSEFAPVPHAHHHHHHHTHHRLASGAHGGIGEGQSGTNGHNHHHHHHNHNQVLTRSETRRYLLTDGPTNATIKLTVEMTHVGGSKEYSVPPNKRGLLVGSLAGLASDISPPGSKGPSSSVGSDVDSVTEAGSGSGDYQHDGTHRRGSHAEITAGGVPSRALSDWRPHSVARHSRIPASNLNTTLTHKDTARAVKEAGVGGRLAFSFAAGAHHERSPEDVIEALFSSSSSNAATTLLGSPRPSQRGEPKPRSSKKPLEGHRVKSTDTVVAARQSSTSSIRRKGEQTGLCLVHTLTHCRKCGRHDEHDKGRQNSTTEGRGVEAKQRGVSATSSTTSGDASMASTAGSSSVVRWDESVADTTKRRGSGEEKQMVVDEDRMLSSSPPQMESDLRSSTDEHGDGESTRSSGSIRDTLLSSMDDAMRPSIDDSLPPNTPPDVARREVLDFSHLAPPVNVPPPWKTGGNDSGSGGEANNNVDRQHKAMTTKQSRRTLGLSREAALNAGYRGAGWGTLDLVGRSTSRASMEGNSSVDGDSASEHERGSTPPPSASPFAYRSTDRTNSPSPLQRATAH